MSFKVTVDSHEIIFSTPFYIPIVTQALLMDLQTDRLPHTITIEIPPGVEAVPPWEHTEAEEKEPEKNEPQEEAAGQQDPKEEKLQKKKVDKGKTGALYKAGWKIKDIADEMRITSATVIYHINTLKEKGELE